MRKRVKAGVVLPLELLGDIALHPMLLLCATPPDQDRVRARLHHERIVDESEVVMQQRPESRPWRLKVRGGKPTGTLIGISESTTSVFNSPVEVRKLFNAHSVKISKLPREDMTYRITLILEKVLNLIPIQWPLSLP